MSAILTDLLSWCCIYIWLFCTEEEIVVLHIIFCNLNNFPSIKYKMIGGEKASSSNRKCTLNIIQNSQSQWLTEFIDFKMLYNHKATFVIWRTLEKVSECFTIRNRLQHSRQRETELSKSIAQLNIFALAHRDMWFGGETLNLRPSCTHEGLKMSDTVTY